MRKFAVLFILAFMLTPCSVSGAGFSRNLEAIARTIGRAEKELNAAKDLTGAAREQTINRSLSTLSEAGVQLKNARAQSNEEIGRWGEKVGELGQHALEFAHKLAELEERRRQVQAQADKMYSSIFGPCGYTRAAECESHPECKWSALQMQNFRYESCVTR